MRFVIALAVLMAVAGCGVAGDYASSTRPPIPIPSTDPAGVLLPQTATRP